MTATFSRTIFMKFFMPAAVFLLSQQAFGQLISLSLDQRVNTSNIIFEGKVTAKTSYWNDTHTQIYTANIVSVYKVFKGTLSVTEVEVITHGGTVGFNREEVSHSLQLEIGDVGMFMAIPNKVKLTQQSARLRFKAYSGLQGFIKYNLKEHTAKDPFTNYTSIATDVYPAITKRTNTKMMTIKEADYKIN